MKLNKKRKGFTLVELIVVIVILGILMLIGSMKYADVKDQANVAVVKTNHRTLVSALQLKMAQNQGAIPTSATLPDLVPSIKDTKDATKVVPNGANYSYAFDLQKKEETLTSTYTKSGSTTPVTIKTTLSDGVTTITGE